MKHQKPHKNKYDKRSYTEKNKEEVKFSSQRIKNYYQNKGMKF